MHEKRPRWRLGKRSGDQSGFCDPCKVPEVIPGNGEAGDRIADLPFLQGVWSEGWPWWPGSNSRDRGGGTGRRTFTDLDALAAWVAGLVGVKNLYFSVNDLSPNTRGRPAG